MKYLIIRPEPGATASAARAEAAGFDPVLLPFFEIRARAWDAPDPADYDALLLTSANAVRQAGPQLRNFGALPLHVVGERTANAAREAGLVVTSVGESGVEDTLQAAASARHQRLLWLTGEDHRSPTLPADITVEPIICYASEALPLPHNIADIIVDADIIVLHSPRAARLFAETVSNLGLAKSTITLAAFSPAIAEAAGSGWRDMVLADKPIDSALLSAVAELVTKRQVAAMEKEI
jgi:uroporphyrinogen-III synthase